MLPNERFCGCWNIGIVTCPFAEISAIIVCICRTKNYGETMKTMRQVHFFIATLVAIISVSTSVTMAHEIFQDILKERYTLKSFSCKTCHPDGDDRTLRTPFADLYYEAMKAGNWTEKYAQAAAKGEAAVTEFEKEVGEAFKKSLEQVGKATLSVDELFSSGLLAGIRIDEKKLKAKSQGSGTSKGSSESDEDDSESPTELPTASLSVAMLPRSDD
jgi:hypothetical protein